MKKDSTGDDLGPKGTYQYPIHETFNRQMDIKKVSIHTTGNNFRWRKGIILGLRRLY